MRPRPLFWICFFLLLALDQGSKQWVLDHLALHDSIPVLAGVCRFTHVANRGIAFGLDPVPGPVMSVIVVLILGCAMWWSRHLDWRSREINLLAALLAAGGIGNLIDRLRHGAVVDFIDLGPVGYPWVFNVADSAITLSLAWIVLRQFVPPSTPKPQ